MCVRQFQKLGGSSVLLVWVWDGTACLYKHCRREGVFGTETLLEGNVQPQKCKGIPTGRPEAILNGRWWRKCFSTLNKLLLCGNSLSQFSASQLIFDIFILEWVIFEDCYKIQGIDAKSRCIINGRAVQWSWFWFPENIYIDKKCMPCL